MKKMLLIIFTIVLILSINVLAVDIDIGSAAENRATNSDPGTYVGKDNPANLSGKITSIEIWFDSASGNATGVEVATFFIVSGDNLSTRDTQTIGSVTAGSKQTFTVDLNVVAGDYIGIHYVGGEIERTNLGVGYWYVLTTDLIPCTNQAFTFLAARTISLYGTGTTEVGWPHKWNTITIGKWNTKEFTKWNGLE